MDSLTQIVLGAAVGEAALGRKVGNKALLWGAIAGTIPDLDVIYIKLIGGDAIDEIVLHRGFSHSILFAFLMAPILGWLVKWLYRKKPEADLKGWTTLFFWSIFTHPLLDSLTTYGTQLFLPFSDYRVSIASVFVVDLFYTLPFLLSVIGVSMLSRTNSKRRILNYVGIGLSSFYLLVGLINKYLASQVFEQDLAKEPQKMELVFTGVTPLNIVLWYGVAESDDAFHVGYYSFFDENKNVEWVAFEKHHELLDGLENEYGIERLKWFSDQLYVVSQQGPDTLNLYTMKFGRTKFASENPEDSFAFYMRVIENPDGTLRYESVRDVESIDMKKQLSLLFSRALGKELY
ncbi:MAG: metal-dependent hydrolase [Flavobacteriales bacterium]|nr:metal-dependent hydrolase [Flavobacteriales bacterium]MCB9205121.1 metal-dependent hydrolase [Flavobacteriales bacterium]